MPTKMLCVYGCLYRNMPNKRGPICTQRGREGEKPKAFRIQITQAPDQKKGIANNFKSQLETLSHRPWYKNLT